jgi:ubiquinone/menaquinone biosynthesis C-methylase UbiE
MSTPAALHSFGTDDASLPVPARNETPKFDRLARVYRWMEWLSFGPFLSQCRRAFLPQFREARSALVLGDGDGRFTSALLRQNTQVRVDAVDASPAMLHALQRRTATDASRLRTEVQDLREWSAKSAASYDLIVTHFFLDCLTTDEVLALTERVTPAATPDAHWVVSEFAVTDSAFGRWVARPLVSLLYRAFGVLTGLRVRQLPDYSSVLKIAGFTLEKERTWLVGLLVAQLWRRKEPQETRRTNDHPG